MNSWSLYLQDSWTIARRLTLNLGLRAESEYLPSYTTDPLFADIKKPINFSFADKLAPRAGLRLRRPRRLEPQGLRQLRHLPRRHEAQHGRQRPGRLRSGRAPTTRSTTGTSPRSASTAISPARSSTTMRLPRRPSSTSIDPDMKPFTQREISLGAREEARGGHVPVPAPGQQEGPLGHRGHRRRPSRSTTTATPAAPSCTTIYEERRQNGTFLPGTPDYAQGQARLLRHEPVARQALQPQLAGRPVLHAQPAGGQLQRPGLAPTRTAATAPTASASSTCGTSPTTRSLNPIDGAARRPTAPHSLKAYGSYALPFGLTVGLVANAYSGTPVTEEWNVDSEGYFPYNRGNLGRTPFVFFANAYAEYAIRLGGRKAIRFNLNVDNI
ncbi:MAG: TonB-dependent receptor [Ignavibacteriales bacterium]|nr:TonB-dependent receptor [Ignavibacteriales bacterium]